jgi:hypothetical protein
MPTRLLTYAYKTFYLEKLGIIWGLMGIHPFLGIDGDKQGWDAFHPQIWG